MTPMQRLLLPLTGVALASILGLAIRLDWVDKRSALRRTEKRWDAKLEWEPGLGKALWSHDEYLIYTSAAVNAFRGRGLVSDYNRARDGVYVAQPGQALFVLGLFHLWGGVPDAKLLFRAQALVSALMIPLSAWVVARLVSPLAGAVAALLVAVHPSFVFWSAFLMTESNYLVGLTLLLVLLLRFVERPNWRRALLAALWLGILSLQRLNALYLGPVMALFVVATKGLRQARFAALIYLVVPYLVPLPWLFHNLRAWGEPVYLNNAVGIQFYLSNHATLDPLVTPYFEEAASSIPELEARFRGVDGRLRTTYYPYSNAYGTAAFSEIAGNPLRFLRNYLIKLAQQFYLLRDDTNRAVAFFQARGRYAVLHWTLLFSGLLGCGGLARWRPGPASTLFLTVFAYFALIHALSISSLDGRYTLNLKLFLTLGSAAGIGLLFESVLALLKVGSSAHAMGIDRVEQQCE